jgi:hypothetical protein
VFTFIKMIALMFIFDEFSFENEIFRDLSSKRLRQQLE